jgi:hypothetical protein
MFLTFCICDYFFVDGDPEFALFLIWILYSSTIKIFSQPAGSGGPPNTPGASGVYAPHTLDIIAAAISDVNNSTCANSDPTAGTCVISSINGNAEIINKFCGSTIGATAAACGFKVAYKAFMNGHRPINMVKVFKQTTNDIVDDFFKWAFSYKKFRRFYSNAIGKLINTIYDIEKVFETSIEYCIEKYDSIITTYFK